MSAKSENKARRRAEYQRQSREYEMREAERKRREEFNLHEARVFMPDPVIASDRALCARTHPDWLHVHEVWANYRAFFKGEQSHSALVISRLAYSLGIDELCACNERRLPRWVFELWLMYFDRNRAVPAVTFFAGQSQQQRERFLTLKALGNVPAEQFLAAQGHGVHGIIGEVYAPAP